MDQRSTRKPLFWLDTTPIFPFCGAEGDGNGGQGGGGTGNSTGNSGDSSGSGGGGQGSSGAGGQGGGGGGQGSASDTVSRVEYEALMARMQQADKNKSAAEKRVAELEGASKTELEKAQQQLADANKRIEDMAKGNRDMLVRNAFHEVKDAPTWHSSVAALKLLDQDLLTVEDDGNIKGMEAAVAKLKTEHPYLIKAEANNDGGDGKGKKGGQQQGGEGNQQRPSGSANNGAGGGGGKKPERADLERRFPALRGR